MAKEILLTQDGLIKLKDELKALKDRRKQVADRIKVAREYGDLSENSEYDDARNEQSFVEGRVQDLEEMIKNARVMAKSAANDKIEMGSVVTLKLDGETFSYEIVGANESDPVCGKISAESPLGGNLIGKAKGEKVSVTMPGGTTEYKIVDVK